MCVYFFHNVAQNNKTYQYNKKRNHFKSQTIMKHLRFLACAIVFCTCVVKGNARIAYYHTANSVIYCDQLVVPADNFVENDTICDSIIISPINLSDYLIEGETYRINEYAAMIYQYGLHFISNDVVDTRPITIEIYRLGEPDSPVPF